MTPRDTLRIGRRGGAKAHPLGTKANSVQTALIKAKVVPNYVFEFTLISRKDTRAVRTYCWTGRR